MGTERSQALDRWDYRVPFARFHMQWGPGDVAPAFEQGQALAIMEQELQVESALEVLARRAVLVTFSSEYVAVGGTPASHEPAWVVILAGRKKPGAAAPYLSGVPDGHGVIAQALVHGRTGEILLGTAVPVRLSAGQG